MKQLWRLRFYREGDEKSIVKLINLVLPEARYTIERWLWEYRDNPHGFLTIVAEYNGRIVGHMALFLVNLKVGNRIIKGSQACDLAVHPDFRRQGMFLSLGKALMKRAEEEKVLVTYGFPNRPAYFGHLKYGWFDAARVPVLINFFDTHNFVREKYEKYQKLRMLDPFLKKFSRFVDYISRKTRERGPPLIRNVRIREVSSVDERMDNFWSRVSKDYGIIVVRDPKYLKWRFFERPDFRYKVLVAESDNKIEGYIILSAEKSRYGNVGYIDDALANNVDVARNLIQSALDFFSRKRVALVRSWMLEDFMWYGLLRERGFILSHVCFPGRKKRFIVRINSKNFLSYYRNVDKGWYITYGDSDYAGGRPSII